MEEYYVTRLTKESIKDVHWLFHASSKAKRGLDEFQKKYNTDFTGVSYIGYLAYDKYNKPAAFYGLVPTIALINGNPVLIAQAVDALTHPLHQHKGLFTKLVLMTSGLAKSNGIHFIFGIPNENSFQVFINKLNWAQNGSMYKFVFKVPMLPFSQLFRKKILLNSIYQCWVRFVLFSVNKESISFPNPNVSDQYYGLLRNYVFVKYKEYSKKYVIEILGKKVWLRFDGTLKIGEIEKSNRQDIKLIIRRLKLIAFFTGIQKIQYQCSSASTYMPVFSSITKAIIGQPIIFLNLTGEFVPENLVLSLADIDTF